MMWWWGFNDGFGWWMILGMVWMVIFWGAIIGVVVWAVSRLAGGSRNSDETPREIAKKRLARGEISREEYDELIKHL